MRSNRSLEGIPRIIRYCSGIPDDPVVFIKVICLILEPNFDLILFHPCSAWGHVIQNRYSMSAAYTLFLLTPLHSFFFCYTYDKFHFKHVISYTLVPYRRAPICDRNDILLLFFSLQCFGYSTYGLWSTVYTFNIHELVAPHTYFQLLVSYSVQMLITIFFYFQIYNLSITTKP